MSENKPTPNDKWDEIKEVHREYKDFYQLFFGCALVFVLTGLGIFLFTSDLPGYWTNVYVSLVATIFTILIVNKQAEQRATRQQKDDLILQMSSPDRSFAVEATRILRQKGWLKDGTLVAAKLSDANLEEANLEGANLAKTRLEQANLSHANLAHANLTECNLIVADLKMSNLQFAHLEKASLFKSDLRGASLGQSHLNGTSMIGANLEGAMLAGAILKGADLREANLERAHFSADKLRDFLSNSTMQKMSELLGLHFNSDQDISEELIAAMEARSFFAVADLRGANLKGASLQNSDFYRALFDETTILPDGSNWTLESDLRKFSDKKSRK